MKIKLRSERWRNYALWVAIASLVLKIMLDAGLPIIASEYQVYVELILMIAVLLGIINDPNEGKGLSDNE